MPIGRLYVANYLILKINFKVKIVLQGREMRLADGGTNIIFLLNMSLLSTELGPMVERRAEPGHEKCNDTGEAI